MRRQPKITKYGKQFKGGKSRGGVPGERKRGSSGLRVRKSGRVSARQREDRRRGRGKGRRRGERGKGMRKGFADTPVTQKPRAVRMGKGKGSVSYWVSVVRRGERRLEVRGSLGQEKRVGEVLRKVALKRPRKTKVVIH